MSRTTAVHGRGNDAVAGHPGLSNRQGAGGLWARGGGMQPWWHPAAVAGTYRAYQGRDLRAGEVLAVPGRGGVANSVQLGFQGSSPLQLDGKGQLQLGGALSASARRQGVVAPWKLQGVCVGRTHAPWVQPAGSMAPMTPWEVVARARAMRMVAMTFIVSR